MRTFTVRYCRWLLIGFLKGRPKEIEEAALVDGATRTKALTGALPPPAAPGIVARGSSLHALVGRVLFIHRWMVEGLAAGSVKA